MRLLSPHALIFAILTIATSLTPDLVRASQVLVTVENKAITHTDLEKALTSSPFYTQFNTLDADEQAAMRGDMLKRLVTARLLEAEARTLKLDKSPAFIADLESYINGVRYQKYLNQLRERAELSEEELGELRQQYADSADALAAARASIVAKRYQALFQLTRQKLLDQYHVRLHEERLTPQATPDTVLMQGDNLQLTYAELTGGEHSPFNKNVLMDKLYQQTEYMIFTQAALAENMDLSVAASRYIEERLPALLAETKIKEWLPDDSVLQNYFDSHPELHKLKDRWHVGQLVVNTRQQAEQLRNRIVNGESSLFQLAGEFSIDPEARLNNGDLGWVLQGSSLPEIENVLKDLNNNEISPVIKTSKGYHLVTILKRRTGSRQNYKQIKDKLRQMVISEHMVDYLSELQEKHRVNWLVLQEDQKKARELLERKK